MLTIANPESQPAARRRATGRSSNIGESVKNKNTRDRFDHIGMLGGALLCCALPGAAWAQLAVPAAAQAPAAAESLEPVVVSATRTALPAFEVPASISVIEGDALRDSQLGVNLSESAAAVPGLVARDRQNYAQDEQVQIRGFGARASFGLRGIRVYVDGIPATLPDGQGWVSNLDLGSVDRIEILRGPYSALYGNSSGGVIQVFTQAGAGSPVVTPGFAAGSNGEVRESTRLRGANGSVGYDVDLTHFQTDGYRDHSAAVRNFANLRLDVPTDPQGRITLVVNSVASPTAQDPLGLTRAQFTTAPRTVDPAAIKFNTRKTFDQTQVGIGYDRQLDMDDTLSLHLYSGDRNAEQYQAITVAAQTPSSPGAVIDLGRSYSGGDLHWTRQMGPASAPLTFTAGLAYDALDEVRLGHLNYSGSSAHPSALGVTGTLRRNQTNTVRDLDEYAQVLWQFLPAWSATAGLRHSRVDFGSTDLPAGTSTTTVFSSAVYSASLPVLGLAYQVNDDLRLYANTGKGFETPTLNELAYRPGGLRGLNFNLQPDHSRNYEVGAKARVAGVGEIDAAVFLIDTTDEIVTQTNSGGHAVYQNAGATRRNGVELGWQHDFGRDWRGQLAYTFLNASYRDAYLTCLTTPCPAPNRTVAAGSRIPGIARSNLYAALGWRPPTGLQAGVEAHAASAVYVDDINSQAAPGYAIAGARVGYRYVLGHWDLSAFARIDNLLDRKYAGSVIVDETSLRFFEPAPGRTGLFGSSGAYSF
jgi:iron complex outermembrane receptor protein